uniref:Uncharacterized protein n=2 Tax=Tetranychus urticae TaxID=32264 RepID=T1KKN0_TETUR
MIESIERVRLSYEVANAAIQKEKEELKVKLLEITKTPEGQKISMLTEQVQSLSVKLRSKEKALEDATRQYTKIQNNIEHLSLEQEKTLAEHERQIEMLRTQLTASREDNIKLDDIVKHLRREKDNLTRDIKRLERDQSRHQEQLLQLEQAKKVSLEQRIVELNEEKSSLKQELDNFKRLLETNGELRMNLEKEVMLLKAKIESYQSFQEEIDRLRRNQANCAEELDKVRDELVTASAMKKDLTIQLQRSEEEYNRVKMILDEERREVFEYKVESDKIVNKLKSCLEEERNEMKIRLDNLNDECKRKHKEREEMKVKCKQYASLVEKLQVEVKSLKDQVEQLEKLSKEMVPLKVYKELKRQYKELKRLLNDLPTSSLVNLSHQQLNQKPALFSVQSNHCKVTKTREKQTTTS